MSDNKKTNYLVVIYKISNTWFFERYSRGLADIPIKLPYNQSQLNFMAFLGHPYEYYHFILTNGKKERFLKKLKKAVQKASDQYSVGKMVKGIDKFLWKHARYQILFRVTSDAEEELWKNIEENVENPKNNRRLFIYESDLKFGKFPNINDVYKDIVKNPYKIQLISIKSKKVKKKIITQQVTMEGIIQYNYNLSIK